MADRTRAVFDGYNISAPRAPKGRVSIVVENMTLAGLSEGLEIKPYN